MNEANVIDSGDLINKIADALCREASCADLQEIASQVGINVTYIGDGLFEEND